MHSVFALAFSLAVASFAEAQAQYRIQPDTVPLATRSNWCTSQKQQCPLLCLQVPGTDGVMIQNFCDPKTLDYRCVCKGGLSPNATEYSLTLPYYICQEWQNQCVAGCGQALGCQGSCRDDHPCGAQNPTRVNTSTISTMPATATPTSTSTGSSNNNFGELGAVKPTPASGSVNNNKNSAISALSANGQAYSLAIVVTGLFAGFSLLL